MKKKKKENKEDKAKPELPKPEASDSRPRDPRTILVGIGASAGGLDAIERFMRRTPANTGMSFVIIQHLSPTHPSFLVELISKMTSMPVEHAKNGARVLPDHVYVIPPKSYIKYYNGELLLVDPTYPKGLNLPIDVFFESLAQDAGVHAVGVILSGTGSDGTTGLRAIKEAGGTVMVQDVESAEFDGMPKNAAATGIADFVLPPEEMADALLRYIRHPFLSTGAIFSRNEKFGDTVMPKIFNLLRERTGVDFSEYRPSTIDRRIERRMVVNQMSELEDYFRFLAHSPKEIEVLFNDFLIPVTGFFRDREVFDYVKRELIPKIFEKPNPEKSIRVWVPSCSTGEEAFSYAMLFAEERRRRGLSWDIKIFATDISKPSIDAGALGFYPQGIAAHVPADLLERYFFPKEHGYQVTNDLRKMVVFALHDLTKNPPFTRLDLISCRNSLIYFQNSLQRKVLSALQFGLKPEGVLVLGTSESIGELADRFDTLSAKHKIYVHKRTMPSSALAFVPRIYTKHTLPATSAMQADRAEAMDGEERDQHAQQLPSGSSVPGEQVYHAIIADLVSTCVVLDQARNVMQVFGDVSEFLEVSSGAFSQNLFKLFPKELSIAIASMLHRLDAKGRARGKLSDGEITVDKVGYIKGRKQYSARLRVAKRLADAGTSCFYLIYLESVGKAKAVKVKATAFDLRSAASHRIAQLENELAGSRARLQKTIGQLETANEELQSSNEELMSSNEELQSTNEELQSVNEELHTVNAEHQRRIDELTRLTNDMNNLLKTSYVGFVLVDADLRIRRISDAVEKMTSLKREDVGAPLEVLGRVLNMPELIALSQEVLLHAVTLNQEVRLEGSPTLLVRMAPYVTDRLNVEGVVITFIEFSPATNGQVVLEKLRREYEDQLSVRTTAMNRENERLVEAGRVLQTENQLLNSIMEGNEDRICAVDPLLRVISFNKAFQDEIAMQLGKRVKIGMTIDEIYEADPRALESVKALWRRAFKEGQYTVDERAAGSDGQIIRRSFLQLKDPGGKVIGAMKTARIIGPKETRGRGN